MSEHESYIALRPCGCICATALGSTDETARVVARWKRAGLEVRQEHATEAQGHEWSWCERCKPQKPSASPQEAVDAFNAAHPFTGRRGVRLRYWPVLGEGRGRLEFARSSAWVLGGHTAVILITGVRGCVALSHCQVEPIGGWGRWLTRGGVEIPGPREVGL